MRGRTARRRGSASRALPSRRADHGRLGATAARASRRSYPHQLRAFGQDDRTAALKSLRKVGCDDLDLLAFQRAIKLKNEDITRGHPLRGLRFRRRLIQTKEYENVRPDHDDQ